jgi:hypothetical protein
MADATLEIRTCIRQHADRECSPGVLQRSTHAFSASVANFVAVEKPGNSGRPVERG